MLLDIFFSPTDLLEQVRAAYRQLALLVHPDKNKDPRAGEAFAKLQKVLILSYEFQIRKHQTKQIYLSLNESVNSHK